MKVSAVIPAYNEEKTVANVINTLKQVPLINEIIVVNDGSYDQTSRAAESCGVRVINLSQNKGKGAAVKAGVDHCSGAVILLLDADLIGLSPAHVIRLLTPVIRDERDTTIGVFCNGRIRTDLAHKISPYLSGQRALKRTILDQISHLEASGYGIEMALTRYVEKNRIRTGIVQLEDMTHIMKEEKYGLIRGLGERMKMYWHILKGLKPARQR